MIGGETVLDSCLNYLWSLNYLGDIILHIDSFKLRKYGCNQRMGYAFVFLSTAPLFIF